MTLLFQTDFGGMIVRNFKVVDGGKGLFVSLPSRAVIIKKDGVESEPKYYNDIRFESQERYNEFRDELNTTVLSAVEDRIENATPEVLEV